MKLWKKARLAVIAGAASVAPMAHAVMAQPDLSDVTTYVETGLTTVGVLALAGLTLFVGLKLYKVARRAI
jgi:hypothetical protein